MRVIKFALTMVFAVAGLVFFAPQRAAAKSSSFTNTFSGTGVTVPLDLDGSDPAALSAYNSGGGKETGGFFQGSFTYQGVAESVPDTKGSPSGCVFGYTECPINGVTGCLFDVVAGSSVIRDAKTGDLLTSKVTSGSVCFDVSTISYVYSEDGTITGGTGAAAGVTGPYHETGSGQFLNADAVGRNFGWNQGTRTGTMTK